MQSLDLLNYRITPQESLIWDELVKDASGFADIDLIIKQWGAAKKSFEIYNRTLPKPVWKKRAYEHDGSDAWKQLSNEVTCKEHNDPISIYIHIPFCDKRCKFCDCYSIATGKTKKDTEYRYATALMREMELWKGILNIDKRPVSTIHFGGGTPNCINKSLFDGIVKRCYDCFTITEKTELAIESVSTELTNAHLIELKQLGFSRLHIGVQSLDDSTRDLIGRREKSNIVIDKLQLALKLGFIVSVDLILGLPKQSIREFISSLKKLSEIGIHGFSLYQLQVSRYNRRFIQKEKGSNSIPLLDYLLFQIAEQYLVSDSYKKNHFDHFSRQEDKNLYSTHMSRGEDLLALGATADGVFNSYHYRHPKIKDYLPNTDLDAPALEGGLWESRLERKVRPVITCLMMGHINKSILSILNAESLLEFWLDCSLIREDPDQREYVLTANGSWFINEMVSQVIKIAA